MLTITLPDGSQRQFDQPTTVAEVARSIGAGLAKAALAGRVNCKLVDVSYLIDQDSELAIITDRDQTGLEVIRHSCAHLLAMAVKILFPSAQVTIGPVIENGFYYDFAFERSFTPEDIEKIEKKMYELAKEDLQVSHRAIERNEAITFFRDIGEEYKARIIEDIPEGEILNVYQQGQFVDLCRGPHVPSTGKLKAFKLTKLAGAYWRGDSNNEMLQRIYGTAWADKKSLETYLDRIAEAEKRDHRKLGRELDLFHLQEEAPGMVFWHEKGWTIYQAIIQYIRRHLKEHNYKEINTPLVVDRSLWERSGHWDKFADEMFVTSTESHDFAIKPMNCPCHVQVFNQGLKSYRDLPIRLAEFGACHRSEPSGTLHGLMRVRSMVQDDAHIFCTEDQIQSEVTKFIQLVFKVYKDFGFDDIEIRLATRPEKRVGSDEIWGRSEKALEVALDSQNLKWLLCPGEGAFYGPKVEFHLRDCLDRVWQCGTIQVDFSMPERLGATYVAEDGSKPTPVMLHRAILGSIERFIGILIEHYAGVFPLWLAPTQVVVMNITDSQAYYVREVTEYCQNLGLRVCSDLRNEKVGFKIREHTLRKVPYQLVVGDREVESKTVAVRSLSGEDLGAMSIESFCERLADEVSLCR